MDKALEQLVEAVKQASPQLWAAAQGKVTAQVVLAWTWALIFLGEFGTGLYWLRNAKRLSDPTDRGMVSILAWSVILTGFMGTVFNLGDLLGILVARDWYAIKALVELSPLK